MKDVPIASHVKVRRPTVNGRVFIHVHAFVYIYTTNGNSSQSTMILSSNFYSYHIGYPRLLHHIDESTGGIIEAVGSGLSLSTNSIKFASKFISSLIEKGIKIKFIIMIRVIFLILFFIYSN